MPRHRPTGPRDLVSTPRVRKALSALDAGGKARMLDQLLEAFAEARDADDLTPINDVIETWYRSMLFAGEGRAEFVQELQGGYQQIVSGDEEGATLEDIRKRLDFDLDDRLPRS